MPRLSSLLAILLAPGAIVAQTPRPIEALGVRFLRGEQLPAPFSLSLVAPTGDGLVAVTVDDRLAGRLDLGREPHSTTEYYLPDDVLQWTTGIHTLLSWMSGPMGSFDSPSFALGAPHGLFLEARGVIENGRRSARFRLNRCTGGHSGAGAAIDPTTLITIAARFRRAALQARALGFRKPPDDAIWYGHAVGCPAIPDPGNAAPPWPRRAAERRPHQEIMQFVVDGNGRVEPGSERFLGSSDPRFTASIRSVLPSWRFTPARRMSQPVRQVMHLNVGFTPPIVLGPGGKGCPDEKSKGVVARLTPGSRPRSRPGEEFLRGMAAAFARDPVAWSLHGASIRFGYDRNRGLSNLRTVPPERERALEEHVRHLLSGALGGTPQLPATFGTDTLQLEVEFGPRCEILFSTVAMFDAISMLPQGDGMIRLANSLEGDGRYLVREPDHTAVTLPAAVFRQFVDTVAVLLPAIDTTGPVQNGPDYGPDSPMFGTEQSLGLNMWLSRTGWIRAGFSCGRAGHGQARFLEVRPSEFAAFRRTALEATQRIPLQPAWRPQARSVYLEHELTCHPVRIGHHVMPSLSRRQDQTSVETMVSLTLDEEGNVDPSGVEFMPGLDSITRASLLESMKRWTFHPAVARGMHVRAKTHLNVILRPVEGDGVVLASLSREVMPEDTLRRTVFYHGPPKSPDVTPVVVPNTVQRVMTLLQPHVDSAQQRWPDARNRFLIGLPLASEMVVTAMTEDNLGNSAFVFIKVDRVVAGVIYGRVWRDLTVAADWRSGDLFALPETDLLDWRIIRPDGNIEGNFLGRFLGRQ